MIGSVMTANLSELKIAQLRSKNKRTLGKTVCVRLCVFTNFSNLLTYHNFWSFLHSRKVRTRNSSQIGNTNVEKTRQNRWGKIGENPVCEYQTSRDLHIGKNTLRKNSSKCLVWICDISGLSTPRLKNLLKRWGKIRENAVCEVSNFARQSSKSKVSSAPCVHKWQSIILFRRKIREKSWKNVGAAWSS